MTTEIKLCVDCAHHIGGAEMRAEKFYRPTKLGYHWCRASRKDEVDGGPTETCASMRTNPFGTTATPACGGRAVRFVPK